MSKTSLWVALVWVLSMPTANAMTCEEFVARFFEGAAQYKIPTPRFELAHVNAADPEWRDFIIVTLSDVRSMMSCEHGSVRTFAVDANDAAGLTTVHVGALTALGIYSAGWTWHEATTIRDQLVSKAKDADIAEQTIEGAKLSLIISGAGVASFQIDDLP
jgi:hypothetical protein